MQEVCRLYWDWEVEVSELGTSLFLIPAEIVKNEEDYLGGFGRYGKLVNRFSVG